MKGQVTLFSSKADEHATPQWLFDKLHAEFEFTLDPCATKENAKCEKFFTLKEDGLKQSWLGERVFCNPPYTRGQARKWIQKGVSGGCEIVVFLLPARTDTKNLFHKYFYDTSTWDYRPRVKVLFLPGRLKFGGAKDGAPFPSMIVIFKGHDF